MAAGAMLGGTDRGTGERIASNLQSTVRDLQRRKARGRRGLAVLEGVRLVEEALAAGLELRGAVVTADLARTTRGQALVVDLASHAVPVEEVGARTFGQLAGTETPQGIVAVVVPRVWTVADVSPAPGGGEARGGAVLVVDGVQDPGNVGTLIRTAHALGAAATVLLRGTADPLNAKALRAAMGATFRHPVVPLDDAAFIAWAQRQGLTLWAAATDGIPLARALDAGRDAAPRKELIAVIVGNEGAGIRPQLNAVTAQRVAIPLAHGAESLNVAVAAGILLYEVLRGR
jgi:TrmH family RNA methyltransferase